MDGTVLQIRNAKNGTERGDRFSTQNGTERNGTRTERFKKKRNDLAEGPCSRTERNDFKKVGTCPALVHLSEENETVDYEDTI